MAAVTGDVGTEIAPETAADPGLAARLDDLLQRTCHLARALTGAEQAALSVDLDGDGAATRKFFNLSEGYEAFRDYRVDPRGLGLHGIEIEPGVVIRLTQEQVEHHPAWHGFGDQAGKHPPMRGWLATPISSAEGDGRRYGLLQLSDKSGGRDFTEEDAHRVCELAAYTGATLDAFRHGARVSLQTPTRA